jgi:hypothetical protein
LPQTQVFWPWILVNTTHMDSQATKHQE